MSRTIVISDSHGRLAPFEAALSHAHFDPSADRLITAGDLLDVGSDDVVSRAEELGAEFLVGNHEVAAALGLHIHPQNESSLAMSDEISQRILSGRWRLAAAADGWLVTHAGVSSGLSDVIDRFGGDVDGIAESLNAAFLGEFEQAVEDRPFTWEGLERFRLIGGQSGPLWFRPAVRESLPSGIKQMVGHTPPALLSADGLRALESSGWLLVDTGGHEMRPAEEGHFRYGLIEGGTGTVVER